MIRITCAMDFLSHRRTGNTRTSTLNRVQLPRTQANRVILLALLADNMAEACAAGAQCAFLALRCMNDVKTAMLQGLSGSGMRNYCTVCGERLELWERVWGRFDHASCRSVVPTRQGGSPFLFSSAPLYQALPAPEGSLGLDSAQQSLSTSRVAQEGGAEQYETLREPFRRVCG